MKISVVIPTYNSEKTISTTLESVFSQSVKADEILIMDDGSTDCTVSLLRQYGDKIKLHQQSNAGVANARNALSRLAEGDLIAFLDHDDIWHPDYLSSRIKMFHAYPEAVGFFSAHRIVYGYGQAEWKDVKPGVTGQLESINAVEFLRQYHHAIGKFASMSFFCIPKPALNRLGSAPFYSAVSGVDDFHFFHTLILLGNIIYNPEPLVAYRITPGAQSASLLKSVQKAVMAMEELEPRFLKQPNALLESGFKNAYSAQRREYGRVLMGVGKSGEARKQFALSLMHSMNPLSMAKSSVWLLLSRLPKSMQPKWPSEWKPLHSQAAGFKGA